MGELGWAGMGGQRHFWAQGKKRRGKKTLNRRRRPLFPLPARRGGAVRLS